MIQNGFAYGVYESLSLGVPVIITDLPVLKELGVNHGNGFILDFDMSNLDVHEIYEKAGKFKFEYQPKKDIWGELLTDVKSTYEEEKNMKYRVRATSKYQYNDDYDLELSKIYGRNYVPKPGEEWDVDQERMELLTQAGYVTVVKEVPDNIVVLGAKEPVIKPYDEKEEIPLKELIEVIQEPIPIENLTRKELFQLADSLDIQYAKNISNANLIKKIKEKQNS